MKDTETKDEAVERPWTEGPWEAKGTIYGWGDRLCITAPEWGDKPMLLIPCHDSAFYTQNPRKEGDKLVLTLFGQKTPEGEVRKAHFEQRRIAVMRLAAAAPVMYEALEAYNKAHLEARDAILHNADGLLDNDQVNHILGIIDDCLGGAEADAEAALRAANPDAFKEADNESA